MATALEQEHCTATQSLSLVKNMLRISVSSICYHRELFSKECFVTEKADKGKKNFIHILSSADHEYDDQGMVISAQIRDAGAFLLTQWLERGVFAAIEEGYLSVLHFAIFTSDPKTNADLLLENYEFKLNYPNPDDPSGETKLNDTVLTKKNLQRQATRFVRSLIEFTSTLEDVPESRWITLQLEYNDSCPKSYEPEYFKALDSSVVGFASNATVLKIRIGELKSDHHELSAKCYFLDNTTAGGSHQAATPTSASAKASGKYSEPSSAFKGSAKSTPQAAASSNKQPSANITDNLKQLMISAECGSGLDAATTPNEGLPPDMDEGSDSEKVYEFLTARKEAVTINAISRDLGLDEDDVKKACEYLIVQELVEQRGRSRYGIKVMPSSAVPAVRAASSRKPPPAPKKKSREERSSDNTTLESIEDINDSETLDLEASKAAPTPSTTTHKAAPPKLRLHKGPLTKPESRSSPTPIPVVGESANSSRKRKDVEISHPSSSQVSDLDTNENQNKKRSVIKEPIHLTRLKEADEDETQKSII